MIFIQLKKLTLNNFLSAAFRTFFCRSYCVSREINANRKMTEKEIDERISNWRKSVDLNKLSAKDQLIHKKHLEALSVCF